MFRPSPRPPGPRPPMPMPEDDNEGLPSRGGPSPRPPQRGSGDGGMTVGPQMPRERPGMREMLDRLGLNRDGTSRTQKESRPFPFPRREGTDPRLPFRPGDENWQTLPFRPEDEVIWQKLPYIRGPVPDVIPPGLGPENYAENTRLMPMPFYPGDENQIRLVALMRAMQGMG